MLESRRCSANALTTAFPRRVVALMLDYRSTLGDEVKRQAFEAANHVVASQLWRAVELNAFNMSKQ